MRIPQRVGFELHTADGATENAGSGVGSVGVINTPGEALVAEEGADVRHFVGGGRR